jgi:ubiquinone/menaquinone biosynthesis C-methylase UbiE
LFGVDMLLERVREARDRVRGINARAGFASADAGRLPFVDGAFDCTFCVACCSICAMCRWRCRDGRVTSEEG